MLADLIHELAQDFELPGFPSDKEGSYTLPLEEDLSISISTQGKGILLFCPFAKTPEKNKELFFQLLLHGNLFGQGTRGGVIGSSIDGNLLTLSQEVAYTPNYKEFKEIVEDFINMVDYWREMALKGHIQIVS